METGQAANWAFVSVQIALRYKLPKALLYPCCSAALPTNSPLRDSEALKCKQGGQLTLTGKTHCTDL